MVIGLFLFAGVVHGQWSNDSLNGDSTKYSLLINPFIQVEATEAINAMYNFEFNKAQSHFNYLQKKISLASASLSSKRPELLVANSTQLQQY